MISNNFLNTNILSNKQLIANNQKVCTNVDTAPPVAKTTPTEPEGSKETIIPTTTSKDASTFDFLPEETMLVQDVKPNVCKANAPFIKCLLFINIVKK
mgnify:CR=1 FL=1